MQPRMYFYFLAFFLGLGQLNGQNNLTNTHGIKTTIETGRITPAGILRFPPENAPSPLSFTNWAHEHLNAPANVSWRLLRKDTDSRKDAHFRLQQLVNGLPVEGAQLILHAKGGKIVSATGEYWPSISGQAQSVISRHRALDQALAAVPAYQYRWEIPQEEAMLQSEQNNPNASWFPKGELTYARIAQPGQQTQFKLAWKFDIYRHQPFGRDWVYVDAATGQVLDAVNRLMHVDAPGIAHTRNSGIRDITSDFNGSQYRLRESGRGNGIETYDLNATVNFWAATDFLDLDNTWNNINPQQDEIATDVHWGTEKTYDYYLNRHGRNSIDNAGYTLKSYVHYNVGFNNATWDGSRMIYGDGDSITWYAVTTLDAIGHEVSHGFTDYASTLDTRDESGALNEGMSDIFAVAIDHYADPIGANWLIGEGATVNGLGIRDLANPDTHNNPDTYQGNNWDPSLNDVHRNSTVFSHWFFLLANGGSGTDDFGTPYAVTGIGLNKAADIAFRLNLVYLSNFSTFIDARDYSLLAAGDLYGACGPEANAVAEAWKAVGLGTTYNPVIQANFSANSTQFCQLPAHARFYNLSQNAVSYLWDFGDGNTSTQANPVHTYSQFGAYTVTLIAYGGACGNDTIVQNDLIMMDPAVPCNVVLDPFNQNTTLTACSGDLYDSGGPTADYHDFSQSIQTISPTGAAQVTLTFSQFDFLPGDSLRIYDGPNVLSPLIGVYSGNSLPNGGIIVSSGPAITVMQRTDLTQAAPGFALTWSCSAGSPPAPLARFAADETNSCDGIIQFYDQSAGNPAQYEWDFGDGTTSNLRSPVHQYTQNGNYTVQLKITTPAGQDVLTRNNFVQVNKPAGPLTVDGERCGKGAVELLAVGKGDLIWYDASVGGQEIGRGNNFTATLASASGQFFVEEVFEGCISNRSLVEARKKEIPEANFDYKVNDREVSFENLSSSESSIKWSLGDGQNSEEEDLVYVFDQDGIYPVSLTVEQNGCSANITRQIVINTQSPALSNDESPETGPEGLVWPNPFQRELNVQMNIPESTLLTAELLDLNGRVIFTLQNTRVPAGVWKANLETPPGLSQGTYLLRVTAAGRQMRRKIVHLD